MLVKSLISTDCLLPSSLDEDNNVRLLASFLLRHGVLTLSERQKADLEKIFTTGDRSELARLWKLVLRRIPLVDINHRIEDLNSLDDLAHAGVPLVVLDAAKADDLNLTKPYVDSATVAEVVRIGQLLSSNTYQARQSLSVMISHSTNRNQFFDEYLVPFFEFSTSIKIFDRYLLEDRDEQLEWNASLKWLLRRIFTRESCPTLLTVVTTAVHKSVRRDELEKACRELMEIAGLSLQQLEFVAAPPGWKDGPNSSVSFHDLFHDRYIEFVVAGESRAISLGKGINSFSASNGVNPDGEALFNYIPSTRDAQVDAHLRSIFRIASDFSKKNSRRIQIKRS